jgi:hypothetical protein
VEQREKGTSYHYGNENHVTEENSSQEGCAREENNSEEGCAREENSS